MPEAVRAINYLQPSRGTSGAEKAGICRVDGTEGYGRGAVKFFHATAMVHPLDLRDRNTFNYTKTVLRGIFDLPTWMTEL